MSVERAPYSGAHYARLEEDEAELARLEAERAGTTQDQNTEDEDAPATEPEHVEPEAIAAPTAEDETWKKRYSDLRRYVDKELTPKFKKDIEDLRRELRSAQTEQVTLPTSDEELAEFARTNPEWYALIETVAAKKAQSTLRDLDERMATVEQDRKSAAREKAEAQLLKYHPDLDELKVSDEFHAWVTEQGGWIQHALYDNTDNWRDAKNAIDLYKAHKGLLSPKAKDTPASKKPDPSTQAIPSKRRVEEPKPKENTIRESEIAAMSPKEFERRMDEIVKAQREGRVIYDLSGGQR